MREGTEFTTTTTNIYIYSPLLVEQRKYGHIKLTTFQVGH
jgi:hypothetical protein